MNRFWVSWYQPTEDYRPLTVPSPEFWCSGHRCSDEAATLCAIIDVQGDDEAAKREVLRFWPEAEEWRFVDLCDDAAWRPDPGRFPPSPQP